MVIKLSPVGAPPLIHAAVRRNLPLPAWTRVRLHIDLKAARLDRGIGHPAAVRREGTNLIKRCPQKWRGFAVFNVQHPNVKSGVGIDFNKGQELPVRRPGRWTASVLAAGQFLQAATAVSLLPENA